MTNFNNESSSSNNGSSTKEELIVASILSGKPYTLYTFNEIIVFSKGPNGTITTKITPRNGVLSAESIDFITAVATDETDGDLSAFSS